MQMCTSRPSKTSLPRFWNERPWLVRATMRCGRIGCWERSESGRGRPPSAASYNQVVRIGSICLLVFSLLACNRSTQSKEAVKQGIIDYVAKKGINVEAMDVTVTAIQFNGSQAEASVTFSPKG